MDGNGSTTTWNYSADRGFMTSKVYADSGAVSYAYNPDGSVSSRTWTRGVVTNYAYNAAGELLSVSYAGDGQPATGNLSFTRDLFGRPTTIADGTGSRTLSYNQDSSISSETIPYISGDSVVYSYDNLGRRTSMNLQNGGTSLNTANYSYDGMSRLASVGNGTDTASYTRISGSSLLATTAIGNLTTTRSYDNLNRLTSISSASPASTMSYSCVYNNSDQRSRLTLADGSYWIYKYDLYGQVTAAHKYTSGNAPVPGQQFDYSFDSIGNRKVEKRNGNISEYTANNLNQYLQRTVPGKVDVTGSADETAEVRIQQESQGANGIFKPARAGKYFSKSFALDNQVNPVSETFNIFAIRFDSIQQKDIVAKQIEKMFLPKTPELYTYDPDGNLLSDGRFTYTWDGENRLIGIESNLGIPARVKLAFSYDYQGRRVSKKSYSWATDHWQLTTDNRFVWDGWNCIAKFDSANNLKESYLWGEDLSGSLQGAGGVGGLLAVKDSTGTYLPCYDGNGNVMAYVDASNGNKVAEYEYDAFGRTIVKAGVKADQMAYRFSSKYLDNETGDYYYGYRYYNADTGRWLGRDPMGEYGGDNLYLSCFNNLVGNYDLLGAKSFRIVTSTDASSEGMRAVKEINSVSEINIIKKITNGGTSGQGISNGYLGPDPNSGPTLYFDDGTDKIPILYDKKGNLLPGIGGNLCRVNIQADIYAKGPEVKPGETYFYYQHFADASGWMSGGVGYEPIGSVVNHEKGHANAFWQKVIPCVKIAIDKIIKGNSSGPFTEAERNEIVSEFQKCSASKEYVDLSILLANQGTRSYFSPTRFTRTFPSDPSKIGIEKGFLKMFGKDNEVTDIWTAK